MVWVVRHAFSHFATGCLHILEFILEHWRIKDKPVVPPTNCQCTRRTAYHQYIKKKCFATFRDVCMSLDTVVYIEKKKLISRKSRLSFVRRRAFLPKREAHIFCGCRCSNFATSRIWFKLAALGVACLAHFKIK